MTDREPPGDLYDMLGVPPSATADEIRRAHRKCVRDFHTDQVQGLPDAARNLLDERLKQSNLAYEILSDPIRRKAYDERRQRAEDRNRDRGAPATEEPLLKKQWIAEIEVAVGRGDLEAGWKVAQRLHAVFPNDTAVRNICGAVGCHMARKRLREGRRTEARSLLRLVVSNAVDPKLVAAANADLAALEYEDSHPGGTAAARNPLPTVATPSALRQFLVRVALVVIIAAAAAWLWWLSSMLRPRAPLAAVVPRASPPMTLSAPVVRPSAKRPDLVGPWPDAKIVKAGDLRYELGDCSRLGDDVACSVVVTNEGEKPVTRFGSFTSDPSGRMTYAVDERGHVYVSSQIRTPLGVSTSNTGLQFEPHVPVAIGFLFRIVPATADLLAIVPSFQDKERPVLKWARVGSGGGRPASFEPAPDRHLKSVRDQSGDVTLFSLEGCSRTNQTVRCEGLVTRIAAVRRSSCFALGNADSDSTGIRLLGTGGATFAARRIVVGGRDGRYPLTLFNQLPLQFGLVFTAVPPSITRADLELPFNDCDSAARVQMAGIDIPPDADASGVDVEATTVQIGDLQLQIANCTRQTDDVECQGTFTSLDVELGTLGLRPGKSYGATTSGDAMRLVRLSVDRPEPSSDGQIRTKLPPNEGAQFVALFQGGGKIDRLNIVLTYRWRDGPERTATFLGVPVK